MSRYLGKYVWQQVSGNILSGILIPNIEIVSIIIYKPDIIVRYILPSKNLRHKESNRDSLDSRIFLSRLFHANVLNRGYCETAHSSVTLCLDSESWLLRNLIK